jgi:nucleoid-associated protein YgaU
MHKFLLSLAISICVMAQPLSADELKLREDAPDKYVVVKGDTLWDISAKFLESPWRWPEIWQLNKEAIRDPHWIYPGDMIVLDRSGGQPKLSLVRGEKHGMPTVKLSPYIREQQIGDGPIQSIPISAIHAFMKQPLLVTDEQFGNSLKILGTNEERVILTSGDTVYASGDNSATKSWQIYRKGHALNDPDSGELLGYEAEYLGDASTLLAGNPQKLRITRVAQEILAEDRLLPAEASTQFEFIPHAPDRPVAGKVISAYGADTAGGIATSGRYQTIVINRGIKDGLEPGHILAVYRAGKIVKTDSKGRQRWIYMDSGCLKPGEQVSFSQSYDPGKVMQDCKTGVEVQAGPWAYLDVGCLKPGKKVSFDRFFDPKEVYDQGCTEKNLTQSVQLPDSRNGLIMVYRVFDRVAYALIMRSDRPVFLLDTVKNP